VATTIITGRDLVLTIASTNYDAQATSATLANAPTIETYQTLDGKAYKHIDDQWTFDVEMLADWVQRQSLCEALWTACETSTKHNIGSFIDCRDWCSVCIQRHASVSVSRRVST